MIEWIDYMLEFFDNVIEGYGYKLLEASFKMSMWTCSMDVLPDYDW